MSEDLIENICELCGIETENVAYPDFYKPENFVKLLELKINGNRTLWDYIPDFVDVNLPKNRVEFLRILNYALCGCAERKHRDDMDDNIAAIKKAIRKAKWVSINKRSK